MIGARAIALQGDTLDAVVWRALGNVPGAVEAALDLNPDLAALGPILPEGRSVLLPPVAANAAPVREIIQLWD